MNELLSMAISAQGGMNNWQKYRHADIHLSVGGILWEMKGHRDTISEVNVNVNLLEQKASHKPNTEWHTIYTPDIVKIEKSNGELIEELYSPRSSFKGHTLETKWNNLQLAYFAGYAMWNYINSPFLFTRPGFEINEVESWNENSETWRRLKIKWPESVHTHSREQTLYIDKEGLVRRLDYQVEIAGNTPASHYLYDYKDVNGIKIATRRVVYATGQENNARLDGPVIVSIDLTDIKLS